MSHTDILNAIPHREPFLLVDEIISMEENHILCAKTFTGHEYFFAGHYPDFPLVPGVLLCESAMQAGAILLSKILKVDPDESLSGKIPVATRMNDVKFKQMVRPGDTIMLDVTFTERIAHAFFMKAVVRVDGKTAVRFDFACTAVSQEK